ncbi:rod shape-determining protein RodA [Mesonia sp. K7]|uniref:rod shape-determining protein RodA n=1 Tax=Mesonia sp. K7 TaxID=2218606 RepID=UPI000DA771DD|nr:rod shape-determining protein RodA [Mesonia sp. K7]PZD79619.1 rod shape-determining protein RodA [Mesonia sp. K7]
MRKSNAFDWLTIILYFILVIFGWMNIYSASFSGAETSYFDMDQPYGKQAVFIVLSVVLIVFLLALESKFYERFASIIYIGSLLSLIGLFVFGKTISGATSWYAFGSFSLQPSEFAKAATALALAKYLSDIQTDIKTLKNQLGSFLIIFLPAILIIPQPDPGSALVYLAFLFPLYREGLSGFYLIIGASLILIFILTLVLGSIWVSMIIVLLGILFYFYRRRRASIPKIGILLLFGILFSFSVNYIFNNLFEQRHRDRFNIVLGKEVDAKGIGYNTNQSQIAIGSGGLKGKGWTQGTQTKGNFVPEQHTDYIFSTVGEEWGFLGTSFFIIIYTLLLIRLLVMAERQKSQFNRVYGYSVLGILFIHFVVNVGMVIGLMPTVGIPLPFFSYGGSGLWGFTILLFIFVKLDGNRKSLQF